jgi:large subunit ribosomal protein L22
MPNFGYSAEALHLDKDRTAKASGRDMRISPKMAREICNTIKGMRLYQAKKFLEDVILLKQAVPFRHHMKKQAHRKNLKQFKWPAGRYPIKAASRIYDLLTSVESNAEFKGLDVETCRIVHAVAHRGRKLKRYMPRAHGRSTPKFKTLTHVEIILFEES